MKILALCPFWQRPEITKYFVQSFKRLQEKVDIELLCVLSKDDPYYKENMKLLKGFHLCEYKNFPVGEKMDAGINFAIDNFDFDYLMNIGSDDIIDSKLFDLYKPYFEKGCLMFGVVTVYFYELYYKNLYFVRQIDDSFPHGGCRMIHRSIIEKVLKSGVFYDHIFNSGLDTASTLRIMRLTDVIPEVIRTKNTYIMSVKTLVNINPMKKVRQHCKKLTNTRSIMARFDFNPDVETHDKSRIVNCRVSYSIKFFKERFYKKWGLRDDHNTELPLLIYGCYLPEDVKFAQYHSKYNKVIILWAGSDSMRTRNIDMLRDWPTAKNIHHIAQSKWIADDLKKAGVNYRFIPIAAGDYSDIKLHPLGDKIYVYVGTKNADFYGGKLLRNLYGIFGKENFIVCNFNSHKRKELIEKYKESFVGLRLVPHDGLSETVIELGMMGRRVIYNGCEPNAINYTGIEDIVEKIQLERDKKGKKQLLIRNQMKEYISINDDWLKVENYK